MMTFEQLLLVDLLFIIYYLFFFRTMILLNLLEKFHTNLKYFGSKTHKILALHLIFLLLDCFEMLHINFNY